jgi:hypothetical protein
VVLNQSNLNIGGICHKLRVSRVGARWAGKSSSRFKHIAQQTSLDFIPVDITSTRVNTLVGCNAHA